MWKNTKKQFLLGGPSKSGAPKFHFANLPASCTTVGVDKINSYLVFTRMCYF